MTSTALRILLYALVAATSPLALAATLAVSEDSHHTLGSRRAHRR